MNSNNNITTLKNIKKLILTAKSIAFFTHVSPDLDGLGSVSALAKACKANGKKVKIFINEELLLEHKLLLDLNLFTEEEFNPENFDLLVCIDTAAKQMLGKYAEAFIEHENTLILDHHLSSDKSLTKLLYCEEKTSSCCQIVLKLIKNLKFKITPEIATFLYSGLSSDTNSFVNDNTNLNSFEDACELVELGADTIKVNDARYKHRTLSNVEIQKKMLNNYEIIDGHIAICVTTLKDLGEFSSAKECSEFSNYLVSIDGIDVGCSLVENTKNSYKCSLRSMKGIDVNKIAKSLGGGGHKQASGALVSGSAQEVKDILIKTIQTSLKEDENA